MASTIDLPIRAPLVPEGFCNNLGADWVQSVVNLMSEAVAVFTGAGTIVLNQENVPDPEQRNFLWHRPTAGRIFVWDSGGGAWTSPNPSPAGGNERRIFEGTPAQIWAYDGGDGSDPAITPPATNVGAMWEIDTNYAGRSPMGVGAVPGSDPALNLILSQDAGAGSHAQTIQELAAHTHGPNTDEADAFLTHTIPGGPASLNIQEGNDTVQSAFTGSTGGGQAMSLLHPVRGVYFIKRTARVNFVAN